MTRVEKEEAASIKYDDLEKYSGWLNKILCIYNKRINDDKNGIISTFTNEANITVSLQICGV